MPMLGQALLGSLPTEMSCTEAGGVVLRAGLKRFFFDTFQNPNGSFFRITEVHLYHSRTQRVRPHCGTCYLCFIAVCTSWLAACMCLSDKFMQIQLVRRNVMSQGCCCCCCCREASYRGIMV